MLDVHHFKAWISVGGLNIGPVPGTGCVKDTAWVRLEPTGVLRSVMGKRTKAGVARRVVGHDWLILHGVKRIE